MYLKHKLKLRLAYIIIFFLEIVELLVYFYLAYLIRKLILPDISLYPWYQFWYNNFWLVLIIIVIFWAFKLWQLNQTFWFEWQKIVSATMVATILNYAMVSILHSQNLSSRLILAILGILVILLFPLVRYILKLLLFKIGLFRHSLLFIGDRKYYEKLQEIFNSNKYLGIELKLWLNLPRSKDVESLYTFANKIALDIKNKGLDGVIIQSSGLGDDKSNILAEFLLAKQLDVLLFPLKLAYKIANAQVYHLMYENYFLIRLSKGLYSRWAQLVKRIIDIVGGTIALIVFSPIMLLTAFLIFIFDGSPVIYVSERYGKNGKLFKFLKFRYMRKDTSFNPKYEEKVLEEFFKKRPNLKKIWQEYKKLPIDDDPRIIPKVGKLIAKFDLAELAQIINVIKGDMSLVGPRPYLPRERDDIGDYFWRIMAVKPGITGLWQVMGGNRRTFKERLEIDTWYPKNWSLWLDIIIILKTIQVVLRAILKKLLKRKNNEKAPAVL